MIQNVSIDARVWEFMGDGLIPLRNPKCYDGGMPVVMSNAVTGTRPGKLIECHNGDTPG